MEVPVEGVDDTILILRGTTFPRMCLVTGDQADLVPKSLRLRRRGPFLEVLSLLCSIMLAVQFGLVVFIPSVVEFLPSVLVDYAALTLPLLMAPIVVDVLWTSVVFHAHFTRDALNRFRLQRSILGMTHLPVLIIFLLNSTETSRVAFLSGKAGYAPFVLGICALCVFRNVLLQLIWRHAEKSVFAIRVRQVGDLAFIIGLSPACLATCREMLQNSESIRAGQR